MGITLHSNYMDALNHSIPLTQANAPGFLNAVHELSQKAGTAPIHVEYVPSSMPGATFRNTNHGKTLGFSDGLFGLLGYDDLHAIPNGEVKAVVGHELSHARYRVSEGATRVALLAGIPMAGMGAMYLIDKTNEKLRRNNQLHPDQPGAWWSAFQETLSDVQKNGIMATFSDFARHSSPGTAKLLGITAPANSTQENGKYAHQDMSWAEASMQEAKYLAVGAAMFVPALAAWHSASLMHEYRADKFAVALTGNKDMANALLKLEGAAGREMMAGAHTALEKGWVSRVMESISSYFKEAKEGAHPLTSKRVAAIDKINIAEAKQYFGL